MKDIKLSDLEYEILAVFATRYPFSLIEVKKCYIRTRSFDATHFIIIFALAFNSSLNSATNHIYDHKAALAFQGGGNES